MSENTLPPEKRGKAGAYLAAIAMLGLKTYLAYYFSQEFPLPENIIPMLQVGAGIFHVAGRVADDVSTAILFNKQRAHEESTGTNIGIKEQMSLLPENPTAKDLLHPGVLAVEAAEALPIMMNPLYGILRGVTSFAAAYNNIRLSRSIEEGTGKR